MASPAPAPHVNGLSTPQNQTSQSQNTSTPQPASQQQQHGDSPTLAASNASSKVPRDVRLLHAILAAKGVTGYQERVPLMLLDFAYRYTASVLTDAVQLSAETGPPNARAQGNETVTLDALRMAIASRMEFQFRPQVDRGAMAELARDSNAIQLPRVKREFGLRLPPEEYCFTGVGYNLKQTWESEGEEEELDLGNDRPLLDVDEEMGDAEQDEFEDVMGGDTAMQG